MAELKTQENDNDVNSFLDSIEPEWKRDDSRAILELMRKLTGEEPRMWGKTIVGFGRYHYKYKSGREGDWFLTGFSPRKQNMTIYMMGGYADGSGLLPKLGKHKTSVGCLYFKKLEELDVDVLEELIVGAIAKLKETYKDFN